MVRSFKQKLRSNKSAVVIVRLKSYGGNLHAMNTMSAFLYFLKKYRKRLIIIEIEHAESAALMLAVNFPHRRVMSKSIGLIHLPVLRKGKYASKTLVEDKKKKAIEFFTSKTKLNQEEVSSLNNVKLTAQQMLDFGIATEMVEDFSPITA